MSKREKAYDVFCSVVLVCLPLALLAALLYEGCAPQVHPAYQRSSAIERVVLVSRATQDSFWVDPRELVVTSYGEVLFGGNRLAICHATGEPMSAGEILRSIKVLPDTLYYEETWR